MEEPEKRRLGPRFQEALEYAAEAHCGQTRKGGEVPYIAHLLSVAALVIEDGGDEHEAIAALLHDTAEDQGGEERLTDIETRVGPRVAGIVRECSDTFETPKPPWRQRKEAYIARLPEAADDALHVSMADKLDNSRAILRDLRMIGPEVWTRFSMSDPQRQLWYYRSLLEIYEQRSDSWLVSELKRTLSELEALVPGR